MIRVWLKYNSNLLGLIIICLANPEDCLIPDIGHGVLNFGGTLELFQRSNFLYTGE